MTSARTADLSRREQAAIGAIASWDWHVAEGRLVGDHGFAALYQLDREEAAQGVPAATFFSIIHPQDQPRIRLAIGAMLRGAEVFAKEYRIVRRGGSVRWVQARGRYYRHDEAESGHFLGTLVDITDQKRAEERLRIAQTAGGIGTFEYVTGFGTVGVSPQFCRLLGLQPAEDLPVRTVNSVVHPGDPRIIEHAVDERSGGILQAEFRIIRPDTGELRWLKRRAERVEESEFGETCLTGVIYDITDAKRTEAQLRHLNDRLEALIVERTEDRNRLWHLSADVMFVARADGAMTAVNPAWTALLGWTEVDLVGRHFIDLVHPDDSGPIRDELSELVGAETLRRFDARCRTRDGEWRWISWSAASGSGLIYVVGRDITAEKQRAEALQQAEEQLHQAQKMEAIGQLTGGIAHDFNNLLTGIIGSLGMLKTRLAQGRTDNLERYINVGEESAARAAALTHRLLAFSRQQTLAPVPTRPNELIIGMQELLCRSTGPEISLETVLAPDLWPTLCDPNQLENALLNLCINARDAMPEGGRLIIETSNVFLRPQAAQARDMAAGHYVMISVTDTGFGMPPHVATRAFDPFFTTKPLGHGTGLGLSMIYGFVKQSGGHAQIFSEEASGTTVRLYLPRHVGDVADRPEEAPASPASSPGKGRTVLVIDDEATVGAVMCEMLEDGGFKTINVPDGFAGLDILRSRRPVDLLVTDVGLPGGLNGRQVADMARAERPGLQVLIVTGYEKNAALGELNMSDGLHILTKPFTLDAFRQKISEIMERVRGAAKGAG